MRPVALAIALGVARLSLAADTVPPAILAEPVTTPAPGDPLVIHCQILDESAVFQPALYWRAHGQLMYESIPLRLVESPAYIASLRIPPRTSVIDWYLEAYDSEANGPARFGSPQDPQLAEVPYFEPHTALAWTLAGLGAASLITGTALLAGTDHTTAGATTLAAGTLTATLGVTFLALDF